MGSKQSPHHALCFSKQSQSGARWGLNLADNFRQEGLIEYQAESRAFALLGGLSSSIASLHTSPPMQAWRGAFQAEAVLEAALEPETPAQDMLSAGKEAQHCYILKIRLAIVVKKKKKNIRTSWLETTFCAVAGRPRAIPLSDIFYRTRSCCHTPWCSLFQVQRQVVLTWSSFITSNRAFPPLLDTLQN